MKKILLLLLLATFSIQAQTLQNPTYGNVKLKNNTTDNSATKVNVQSTDGTINTISKSDLVNVVEVNDVPSLPLIGEAGKIYVVKNVNKIYRWNGTFCQELAVTDISGKEDIANKQNSLAVDGTGTKYPTVDAVFDALATKAPISSVHNPVTLGTANGLSLSTQQLSLGLASSGVTGALSGTDWNTFNNKVNGTGTNNFLTKWSGTNTVNASGAWRETSNRLANAADNGSSDFQVTGQIDLKSKNTQGDGGQLGAELLTTGSSDASWTGTSFATGYTHVAGSVTTLTSTLAPVINNLYQVAYTVTGRTAGSFNIAFGGATTAGIISSSAVGHKASTTGTLVITPTSDFNGTIILSIKQITAGTASFVFRDNGGTIRSELRILANGNTANGASALQNNTTGNYNTANGASALQNNTTGNYNIANGASALQNNTTGNYNIANGVSALLNNTTGNYNIANGVSAGRLIANGTPLTVANRSTFLGVDTKALSDNSTNETVVGYNAIGDGNNTVSIGNTSVVSSRLRGRILQGNVVDNLIDSGQFSGNVLATGFKTASGTASQFLKANGSVDATVYAPLASPSLTGTPTAPTATAGANTTQVANAAFVTSAISTVDSGNVKLTGNQTISGQKSFSLTGKIDMQTNNAFPAIRVTALGSNGESAAEFINNSSSPYSTALRLQTSSSGGVGNTALNVLNQSPIGTGIFSNASNSGVSISSKSYNGDSYVSNIDYGGTGRNYVGRNDGTETYSVDKIGNVIGNSYIKRSTPANNILLAGGGDIAQNTAFNKNFGTTAGTVVEGGTLGTNAYTSTAYLPLTGGIINGSLAVQNSNYTTFSVKGTNTGNNGGGLIRFENQDTLFGEIAVETESAGNGVIYLRSLTNGAITQKASIASSGVATFSSRVTATSYTATSLPVFENNAAASSLAVGQFYRTSIGVLMVKF